MSEKEKLPWGLKPDQIAPGSIKVNHIIHLDHKSRI